MRIVQINAVAYGSTGRIMFRLADALEAQGHQVLCTTGFTWKSCDRPDHLMTSGLLEKSAHIALAKVTGCIGCFSTAATKRLLKRLDDFQPELIHLHNLHGWFLNLPMLFDYIRSRQIPVVWTLHDCWAFTGHCPHFEGVGCDKWRTGCHHCSQYKAYPATFRDHSETMYRLKRQWFSGVQDLTLVTPSRWMAEQVGSSFLGSYPVRVIPNGIDPARFRPVEKQPGPPYTVLGVAYAWDRLKGLDAFLDLRKRLDDSYRIVLVGTDEAVDAQLPPGIESIHRTQDVSQLARLYAEADVFVNPTLQDTFPTVNMEALACGTPVVTFDTGGSPEIPDETCGITVAKNDMDALEQAVRRVCEEQPFSRSACRRRGETFDEQESIRRYLALYRSKL